MSSVVDKPDPDMYLTKILFLLLLANVVVGDDIGSGSNETSISTESNSEETVFGRRIIGGKTARPGQYSYVARLIVSLNGHNYICSGTVLSNVHILTAAHCVSSGGIKADSVLALIVSSRSLENVVFSRNEIYSHPNYNDRFSDDIAILKLNGAKMSGFGTAPSLPNAQVLSDISRNTAAVAAGWGKTSDAGSASSTLQYVNLNTIENNVCRRFYGSIVTNKVICTLNRGKGICSGDSGGPLMVVRRGITYVIGVNAFGSTRCERYSPSGFTYVLAYMEWIHSVL